MIQYNLTIKEIEWPINFSGEKLWGSDRENQMKKRY